VPSTVVFYISGHGFGHASRTIEVINTLVDRRPGLDVVVRSPVAPWLVQRTARPGVRLEPVECDTGVVQIDSLRLNEAATLRRARAFQDELPQRAAAEAAELARLGASLVVADIPPLAIAAARRAGLPSVALGNFTWDWIYAGYDGGGDLAAGVGAVYADTTLALRLPMSGGFATMPAVRDLPFVARRSTREPREVREALGLPLDRRVALVSFGGYGLAPLAAVDDAAGCRVIGPHNFDEALLYARGLRYVDLVRAVDAVVTKPGYGIIADCVANGTAIVYTSRGHFREYEVLVAAMPRFLRCAFISHADLFAGRWAPALEAALAEPDPPERPAVNGADLAADILLERLSSG
jgi:hypothetical protein